MNDNKNFCYHHPKQTLIGVCPLCLNDKLLPLKANQSRRSRLFHRQEKGGCRKITGNIVVGLPKIITLGSIFNHRELRQSRRRRHRRRSYGCNGGGGSVSDHNTQSTSTSLDDSFISIKFEENGVALWDNNKVASEDPISVVELPKVNPASPRWRKRMGHVLQLVKWKRSVNQHSAGQCKC